MSLLITNLNNGLSKTVDASPFNMYDLQKTYEVYLKAGFSVEIIRI